MEKGGEHIIKERSEDGGSTKHSTHQGLDKTPPPQAKTLITKAA